MALSVNQIKGDIFSAMMTSNNIIQLWHSKSQADHSAFLQSSHMLGNWIT